MNVLEAMPFIPGRTGVSEFPLQRYLPGLPAGQVETWLQEKVPTQSWVIDPFGSSPHFAVEAARAGYNILVVCNNPVLQFYLEVLSSAPSAADFYNALAAFSREKQGEERLETYLGSLYHTSCPACHETIQAKAFIWGKDEPYPLLRLIDCPRCKTSGEFPVTGNDKARLDQIGIDALHRARALQNATLSPESADGAEIVVSNYQVRPLHFLFTIINRLDRLQLDARQKKLFTALLLHALDMGNSNWPWPAGRTRPRIVNTPAQFVEHNLWQAIEQAVPLWSTTHPQISLTHWPDKPASPGICLFQGRIGSLDTLQDQWGHSIDTAITVFPRSNQAFWSLTAAWSGWLWGKQTAAPLKSALERKRFDWFWFNHAMHQSLLALGRVIPRDGLLFGVIPEVENGFLTAVIAAAGYAGFSLQGIAYRKDEEIAQGIWQGNQARSTSGSSKALQKTMPLPEITKLIRSHNQPVQYLSLYLAGLASLAVDDSCLIKQKSLPYYAMKEIQQLVTGRLDDSRQFESYRIQDFQFEYKGFWPINQPEAPVGMLSDRIEEKVLSLFIKENIVRLSDIDRAICRQFPGLQTPDRKYIQLILSTYGIPLPDQADTYQIAEHAMPEAIAAVRSQTEQYLSQMAQNQGFETGQFDGEIRWFDKTNAEARWIFHLLDNAAISHIIFSSTIRNKSQILVLPDFVSPLIRYKFQINPRLEQSADQFGYVFRYSRIEEIVKATESGLETFSNMLNRAPDVFDRPIQSSIFDAEK